MTRVSILFTALALTTACDNAEPSTTAPSERAAADSDGADALQADESLDGKHGAYGHKTHRGHRGKLGTELCAELECTPEQEAQISEAFAKNRGDKHERPDHSAQNEALADAFRGASFGASDIEAYASATRGDGHRGAKRLDKMATLHGILTPEQRTKLATKIESGDVFGGGGKRHGKHFEGDKDPSRVAEHIERKVEHFCEPLSCTDAQKNDLRAVMAQAKADRPEKPDGTAGRKVLADAMRSDDFEAAAVRKDFEAAKGDRADHKEAKADAMVAVHGILTAEQRATIADRIEDQGLHAVLGGRGGKRGRHGKHGKFGKRGGKRDKADAGGKRFEQG